MALNDEIAEGWRSRIKTDYPNQPSSTCEGIVSWLLGETSDRLAELDSLQLAVAKQAMDYRYRILQQRYLDAAPAKAYQILIQRLSSLFLIRSKIRTWVALSRDRHRTVIDVLQEVIQELIQNDKYIRQQMLWIAQCTSNARLRNALMLATIEEYCLRPIRNQPLLIYRFVNYLRRTQRGGMTQVPTGDLVRLVSEEIAPDDTDNTVSLLDGQAVAQYQDNQAWEEQQTLRTMVKQEFVSYLAEAVEPDAAHWLELHLQGQSQEAIAKALGRPIKEVYRLREKISYHAIRVFALKHQLELVTTWLGTAVEQNFGLTPAQWQHYWGDLTSDQQYLLEHLKAGQQMGAIAQDLKLKASQLNGEFIKLYIAAQSLRGAS
jgi:hypothetical protein